MAESHTVARTFLKGFAATLDAQPSGLVVYEKRCDLAAQVAAQTLTSAEYISTQTDFYMLVEESGAKDPLLEESLSKIEQHWPSFARALRTPGVSLTVGQLGTLAAIAGLWEARSQRTINALRLRFQGKISQERFKLQSSGLFGAVLERAIAAFVLEHFDLEVVHDVSPTAENWALAVVPELSKSNYEILRRLNIAVLTVTKPPEGRPVGFFTSDHPVAWVDTVNFVRDATPCPIKIGANVEVTFPLSKTKCLLFSYAPIVPKADVDNDTVDVINARSALCALEEVYAPPAVGGSDKARHLRSMNGECNPFASVSTRIRDPEGQTIDPGAVLLSVVAAVSAQGG